MEVEDAAVIRIRFHGRGGQGVKTAGRILGTTAFLAGWQAQDSPIYGAERRGAAVASFVRLDRQPIRERGLITRPDLLVVADEALLLDPAAGVLAGAATATAMLVNTVAAERVVLPEEWRGRLVTADLTGIARSLVGRATALSAALGAAAARLLGLLDTDCLQRAVHLELSEVGMVGDELAHNEQLAAQVFAQLPAVEAFAEPAPPLPTVATGTLASVPYEGALRGAPSVLAPGNSALRHTGTWRSERPVIDPAVCTRCGLCFVQCPDGAIALDAHGYPVIDYDHCKGCLICGRICPVHAIREQRETSSW